MAGRIAYAMSRDEAIPFSGFLKQIYKGTKAPVRIITVIFCIDVVLCLIALGNTTAFNALVSISTVGF